MEVEATATATITAPVAPKEDETVQETSPVTKDSTPAVTQGQKRPASVDNEEDAADRKLVIDEQQDSQVAKEEGATETKEDSTEDQETSQDADGVEAGEIPATTGRGKKSATAKKATNKRARKETPAQAKTRAVRASRRRERSAAAITKIRALVPGTGPRTDHTRVIENLLAYLYFFSQAIDSTDLETFQNTFVTARAAEPSVPSPSDSTTESTSSEFVPPVGDDPVTSN